MADRSVQRGKMMNLASEGILGIAAFVQHQHYVWYNQVLRHYHESENY